MQRFRKMSEPVAVVLLMSLLLTACRVTEVPTTAYPGVASYPGPYTQGPTRVPTTAVPWTHPVAPTVPTPAPSDAPTRPPTAAPTQGGTPGEVAFTLTLLHTGEVGGEVSPCG